MIVMVFILPLPTAKDSLNTSTRFLDYFDNLTASLLWMKPRSTL